MSSPLNNNTTDWKEVALTGRKWFLKTEKKNILVKKYFYYPTLQLFKYNLYCFYMVHTTKVLEWRGKTKRKFKLKNFWKVILAQATNEKDNNEESTANEWANERKNARPNERTPSILRRHFLLLLRVEHKSPTIQQMLNGK